MVAGRRAHADQGQHLQGVVLDHVAHRPDGVVEAAAVVDAEVLGDRHLYVGDVLAVPDRLQDRVGEAQVGDVHHRLLAEVMVDAQDLLLVEHFAELGVELAGRSESWPKGFSITTWAFSVRPASPSPWTTVANSEGGISR